MKLSRLLCLVLVLGSVDAAAQTRLYCEEFDASGSGIFGSRGCALPSMPSYNQSSTVIANGWFPKNADGTPNRGASNLCVPTAAAMVGSAIADAGLQLVPGSFMDTEISQAPNWWSRIHAFADVMKTDPVKGTLVSSALMSGRSVDVVAAAPFVVGYNQALITNSTVLNAVDSGVAMLMEQGWYKKTCAVTLPLDKSCTYQRTGGHAIALQGAFVGMSSSYIIQFDPGGPVSSRQQGVVRYRSFRRVPLEPNASQDLQPHANSVFASTDLSGPFTAAPVYKGDGSLTWLVECHTCATWGIVNFLSGIKTN